MSPSGQAPDDPRPQGDEPGAGPAPPGPLEAFTQGLKDLRELHGNPSFELMGRRAAHAPGAAGSKNTFNKMVLRTPGEPPRPDFLRGFVLGLGADADMADAWERRRKALVAELQDLRSPRHPPAPAPPAAPGAQPSRGLPPAQPPDRPPGDRQAADLMPADLSPTDLSPADRPPTDSPPTDLSLAESPPTDLSPADRPPTDSPPTDLSLAESPTTDLSPADRPPTDRPRRPSRRTAMLAAAAVASALAATAAYSAPSDDDGPTEAVTGRVTCDSGAPVVGVYIEAGSQARSGFASFRADENDPSTATYAWSLPPGRRHSVHVGCGGTGKDWTTDNRSADVNGSDNTFTCRDSDAVARRSHFGRCEPV